MTPPLPVGPYPPNNELVAVAWLGQRVAGLLPASVGTTLPVDITKWADTGFLQVSALPGGLPDVDVPLRRPILQLDAWATANTSGTASSIKPPWNLANRLVELVRLATEAGQTGYYGKPVTMPANYGPARVQAAYLVSEPRRVNDDPSGYARFTVDLAIDWAPA